MANNPLAVPLGVCKVFFNEVEMGYTIGGVEYSYKPEFHKTFVDQVTAPIESWLIKEEAMAKVPLAESTLANLKTAIAHATDNTTSISFGGATGRRTSPKAHLLRLHPIGNAAGDDSEDARIYKAYVASELTLPFKNDGERVAEVTFEGLADVSRATGDMLGMVGDSL